MFQRHAIAKALREIGVRARVTPTAVVADMCRGTARWERPAETSVKRIAHALGGRCRFERDFLGYAQSVTITAGRLS